MTFRQNGCRKNGDGRCERAAVLCVAWFTSAKENKYSLKKKLVKGIPLGVGTNKQTKKERGLVLKIFPAAEAAQPERLLG